MLKMPRWEAEVRLIQNVFPQFVPFTDPGKVAGFRGYIRGPRTGIAYLVIIQVVIRDYPEKEPGIYMDPHPESHHWITDNRLCYTRQGHVWKPAEDTFAQALTLAVKYIVEFDGRG